MRGSIERERARAARVGTTTTTNEINASWPPSRFNCVASNRKTLCLSSSSHPSFLFFLFFSTTREKKRRNGKIIELAAADKSPIEEDAAEFAPGTVIPSPLCVLALTRDSTNLASDRLARALLIFLFLLFLFCLCVPGRWKRPGADLSRFF